MCCCARLHRHQIHLISYGIVSCGLITTGLVFTVFAIFQKESQIGKVWLAGPTTMVVGLVLAGKVVIDWGPAMLHAREGSIDSRLFDQMNSPTSNRYPEPMQQPHFRIEHEPKCNGGGPSHHYANYNNMQLHGSAGCPATTHCFNSPVLENGYGRMPPRGASLPRTSIGCIPPRSERMSPDQCLIYSQYNSSLNKLTYYDERHGSISRYPNNIKKTSSPRRSPMPSLYNTYSNYSNPSNHSGNSGDHSIALSDTCECTQYGSMRRSSPISTPAFAETPSYQGESFVLNERSYLI